MRSLRRVKIIPNSWHRLMMFICDSVRVTTLHRKESEARHHEIFTKRSTQNRRARISHIGDQPTSFPVGRRGTHLHCPLDRNSRYSDLRVSEENMADRELGNLSMTGPVLLPIL
ncbi:hypothetical protein PISMIDRAFT_353224 [Pisolithus microcarpus 441]|uniref:Uncharacterized protein n=1 Tax=Pisolithus microcarpus 441 TaxID=765257 RepID=A0A0C9Z792_9AGAM|nr:hypothetical protein PISMIDRAFT_353224 [Pisolithus microcarpus 441]